jgi:hypothetical protein
MCLYFFIKCDFIFLAEKLGKEHFNQSYYKFYVLNQETLEAHGRKFQGVYDFFTKW